MGQGFKFLNLKIKNVQNKIIMKNKIMLHEITLDIQNIKLHHYILIYKKDLI